MFVDDRLDTVLHTPVAGRAGTNTQLRQLIDLLGRTAPDAWTARHDEALARIDALHGVLGDAAAAVLIGLCTLRSPRLVGHLATLGPRTAVAAINRARLSDAHWLDLVPALPIHARGALRHRRDLSAPVSALLDRLGIADFVLTAPPVEDAPTPAIVPPDNLVQLAVPRRAEPPAPVSAREGIGAIVRRIEAFRRNRQDAVPNQADPGQTRLPFAEDPPAERPVATIDAAIAADGTIIAVAGIEPALLVGHRLFVERRSDVAAWCDSATLAAVAARRPIVAGLITIDGAPAIAGAWQIDASPRFAESGGQFAGYHARLRRPDRAAAEPARPADPGADALQQMLHELRTPINAIQGFAELIQQQMLGPVAHQYRGLAAQIAADAARMLAGFEDVDRVVRLESGRLQLAEGMADLTALMTRLVPQLDPLIAPRAIRIDWRAGDQPLPVAIAPDEAERLVWRLLATIVGAAAPGERLRLVLESSPDGAQARLALDLPAALARREDEALFAADATRGQQGIDLLGHGFALRLALAEVRAAGGSLDRDARPGPVRLVMTLPLVTPAALDRTSTGF